MKLASLLLVMMPATSAFAQGFCSFDRVPGPVQINSPLFYSRLEELGSGVGIGIVKPTVATEAEANREPGTCMARIAEIRATLPLSILDAGGPGAVGLLPGSVSFLAGDDGSDGVCREAAVMNAACTVTGSAGFRFTLTQGVGTPMSFGGVGGNTLVSLTLLPFDGGIVFPFNTPGLAAAVALAPMVALSGDNPRQLPPNTTASIGETLSPKREPFTRWHTTQVQRWRPDLAIDEGREMVIEWDELVGPGGTKEHKNHKVSDRPTSTIIPPAPAGITVHIIEPPPESVTIHKPMRQVQLGSRPFRMQNGEELLLHGYQSLLEFPARRGLNSEPYTVVYETWLDEDSRKVLSITIDPYLGIHTTREGIQ